MASIPWLVVPTDLLSLHQRERAGDEEDQEREEHLRAVGSLLGQVSGAEAETGGGALGEVFFRVAVGVGVAVGLR